MAPGNFVTTTTGQGILETAWLFAGVTDSDILDIGSANFTSSQFAVSLMNDAEREVVDMNPMLTIASTTATVSADSRSMTLPAAVFGSQIDRIIFTNSTHPQNGQPIPLYDRDEGENRIGVDDVKMDVSPFAYWSPTRTTINLAYKVSVETTFTVYYRSGPTAFTVATLASATSKVPNLHINTVYLRLARKFCDVAGKSARSLSLRDQIAEADKYLQDALVINNEQYKHLTWYEEGYPPSSLQGANTQRLPIFH